MLAEGRTYPIPVELASKKVLAYSLPDRMPNDVERKSFGFPHTAGHSSRFHRVEVALNEG